MHQRRDGDPFLCGHPASLNRVPTRVRQVEAALQGRWSSASDLGRVLGCSKSTAYWCIRAIGRRQYVFSRKTSKPMHPREYRIYPEATQVQRCG